MLILICQNKLFLITCFDAVSDRIQPIVNSEAALNFAVSKNSLYLCIILSLYNLSHGSECVCVAALSVSHKILQDKFKES